MIKGIDIELLIPGGSIYDQLGNPIKTYRSEILHDVLIGEPSADEITDEYNRSGKRLAYTLAISKGDTHDFENCKVRFFGQEFYVTGYPTEGIEANIPLKWNKKVRVTRDGQ